MNKIFFSSDIITDHVINKGEQRRRYKIVQWMNKGYFGIFNDISDHVTLFQLEDLDGNINQAASIKVYCIFDSKL